MGVTGTCLSFLKLLFLNPVETVAAVAALVFLFNFLIRATIRISIRSGAKPRVARDKTTREAELIKLRRLNQIQSQLDKLTFEDCNRQELSPLFNTLPAELRNEVFRWALQQHEDLRPGRAYAETDYWYRPGLRGPLRSAVGLLCTCRRVYLETRRVIMREAEHVFWFNRGPDWRTDIGKFMHTMDGLSAQAARDMRAVHFFTQMFWIEEGALLNIVMRHARFLPRKLTVTFRNSDWWNWEVSERLTMKDRWLRDFQGPPSLKELVVEYETLDKDWRCEEMMQVVERNKRFKLMLRDGAGHLSADNTQLREWRWQGSGRLGGTQWPHSGLGDRVNYVVVVDRWTWMPGTLTKEDRVGQLGGASTSNGGDDIDSVNSVQGDDSGDGGAEEEEDGD